MNVWSSAKDPCQTHIWESSTFLNLSNTNLAEYMYTFIWASQVVLVVKNLPANAGDLRDMCLTLELGRSPGGRHGNSLQQSCLESPMDRRAWWATVQKVTQCQTRLKQLSAHTHPDTSWFPGDWPSTEIKYPSPDSKPLKSQCALQPLSIPAVPYNHSCLVMYTLMMM